MTANDRDFGKSLVIKSQVSDVPGGSRDDWLKRVEAAGLLPVGRLRSDLRQRLEAIQREDQYERAPATTSAAATLVNGEYLPRVVFIRERLVRQWLLPFYDRYVKPESVADISPSPYRIPLPYREGIWTVGETSMGSLSFVVELKDGSKFGCLYPGARDLIELPKPYTPADIVDLEIGIGLAKAQKIVLPVPDFVWCPHFESPEEELDRATRLKSVPDLFLIGTGKDYAVELRLLAQERLLNIAADTSNPRWLRSAAEKMEVHVRDALRRRLD